LAFIDDIKDRWFALGLQLKVKHKKLKDIALASSDDDAHCCFKMLLEWLCSDNDPPPSVDTLVEALKNVRLNSLAEKIWLQYVEMGQYNVLCMCM